MVILSKIYTKTGDDGMTSTGNNIRRKKTSSIMRAIGAVDEANSAIGLFNDNDDLLDQIQNDLFDVGADLSVPASELGKLRVNLKYISYLEENIDRINQLLPTLTSFILPQGPLHNARAIVRRAEREVWQALEDDEDINLLTAVYLNRLSDLLFVLARYRNEKEKLWQPGASH